MIKIVMARRFIRCAAGFTVAKILAMIMIFYFHYRLSDPMLGLVIVGSIFVVDFMHNNNIDTPVHMLAAIFFVLYSVVSAVCKEYGWTDYISGFDIFPLVVDIIISFLVGYAVIRIRHRFEMKDELIYIKTKET